VKLVSQVRREQRVRSDPQDLRDLRVSRAPRVRLVPRVRLAPKGLRVLLGQSVPPAPKARQARSAPPAHRGHLVLLD
jgi:hypothetical protein